MPTLIRGDRLLPPTRAEVLSAYGYRWTVENQSRAEGLFDVRAAPGSITSTDAEWLRAHAFWCNRDGRLTANRKSAEPADWASDPPCICCKWHLRPQDHANPIPGTATFKCDMCAHGWGACCKER
jgi:hypothetical protein